MISDAKSPWTLCWIAWRGFISENFERITENFKPCQLYFNPNNSTTLKLFSSFIHSNHSHANVDKMIASFSEFVVSMYEKDIVPVGIQNHVSSGTNNIKYVEAAKKIMAEEYATITIKKLSERLFLNRRYFCEVFKSVSDISPQEYLINLRLQNSLLYLEADSMTLKQISAVCGYSSYNGYVEAFRKKFGMTPKEYRKNIYIQKDEHYNE
jgi:AraC-like DNA-binding protein